MPLEITAPPQNIFIGSRVRMDAPECSSTVGTKEPTGKEKRGGFVAMLLLHPLLHFIENSLRYDWLMTIFNVIHGKFTTVWNHQLASEINAVCFLHEGGTIIFFIAENTYYGASLPD